VKRLPEVVSALNNEVTSLIGMKNRRRHQRKSCLCKAIHTLFQACWRKGKITPLPCPSSLSLLLKRATDPIWSLKVYSIERSFTKPEQPVFYYLCDGPKHGFVGEELLVVPPNTQLPPEQILKVRLPSLQVHHP